MNSTQANLKCYWENPSNHRYYRVWAQKDLLGDWVVIVCWGRKRTNLGRIKSVYCEDLSKVQNFMSKVDRIRSRHGYCKIQNHDGPL